MNTPTTASPAERTALPPPCLRTPDGASDYGQGIAAAWPSATAFTCRSSLKSSGLIDSQSKTMKNNKVTDHDRDQDA